MRPLFAREPNTRIHNKIDVTVRHREKFLRSQKSLCEIPPATPNDLIGKRRCAVAVADNMPALLKRGDHDLFCKLRPRRKKEKKFRSQAHFPIHQEVPHFSAKSSRAGFLNKGNGVPRELHRERFYQGALPRSFTAFYRNQRHL